MSLDLFERETDERYGRMTPLDRPEAGAWDGFLRGSAMHTMQGFAKAARAAHTGIGAIPVAYDMITSGTEAQDRYFGGPTRALLEEAVDHWTPKPGEVGMAGQVTGTLLSLLPLVIASPAGAVATTQLSMAEDLIKKGVDPVKAQAVGAAYGLGIGLGIWVPILGRTLPQRMLLGGAGFNVTQGIALRGAAGEILTGTPAEGEFRAFGAEELTLDVLLGLAFGGLAHLSPAMRAQGEEFWQRVEAWRANLTPEQVAALAVLRVAQHATADSLPGQPTTPESVEAHVTRVRAAIEQLAKDEPVNVLDLPPARVTPDPARMEEGTARATELTQTAEAARQEEGLPRLPEVSRETSGFPDLTQIAPEEQPMAIGRAVEQALTRINVEPEEARANATLWESFFRSASDRYGVPAAKILEQYGVNIKRLGEQEDLLGALAQPRRAIFYSELGRHVEGLKQESASPEQWKGTLKNLRGVKHDELQWSGLEEWLDLQQGKVTKQAVREFLAGNAVRVEEVVLGQAGEERTVIDIQNAVTRREIPSFREISRTEHEAFQGAEGFTPRSAPLIDETKLMINGVETEATVVISKDGVHIVDGDGGNEFRLGREIWRTEDWLDWRQARDDVITSWRDPEMWAQVEHIVGDAEIGPVKPPTAPVTRATQQGFDITPAMREKVSKGLPLFQPGRGQIQFGDRQTVIGLFENADRSTFLHETGHFFLQVTRDLAERVNAPEQALTDWGALAKWLKIEGGEIPREAHEQFARGFEAYLREGKAPSEGLAGVFEQFKRWLAEIYQSITELDVHLSPEVRGVMDRMLTGKPEGPAGQAQRAGSPPPRRGAQPAGPAGQPREPRGRDVSRFLREIRELGGIEQRHFEDITGEKRFGKVKGLPWGVFRPGGLGLDDINRMLADRGWPIPADNVDEGVQALRDMVRAEIEGTRATKFGTEDEVMTAGRIMQDMDEVMAKFAKAETEAAEKFGFNQQDPRYQQAIARIREQRDSALGEVSGQADTPLQAQAARIAHEKPNLKIRTGEDAEGKPVTVSARQYLEDASQAAARAMDDAKLFEIAAACIGGVA